MINTKAYMNYINDIIKCLYNRRMFFYDSSVKGLILLCMIDIHISKNICVETF